LVKNWNIGKAFGKDCSNIGTGKYHGLLAWSPDRLSRNMKEAGEIIEMIELELHGDNELPMFGLGEMTKWKI